MAIENRRTLQIFSSDFDVPSPEPIDSKFDTRIDKEDKRPIKEAS
jgi:hypothetical protein